LYGLAKIGARPHRGIASRDDLAAPRPGFFGNDPQLGRLRLQQSALFDCLAAVTKPLVVHRGTISWTGLECPNHIGRDCSCALRDIAGLFRLPSEQRPVAD